MIGALGAIEGTAALTVTKWPGQRARGRGSGGRVCRSLIVRQLFRSPDSNASASEESKEVTQVRGCRFERPGFASSFLLHLPGTPAKQEHGREASFSCSTCS